MRGDATLTKIDRFMMLDMQHEERREGGRGPEEVSNYEEVYSLIAKC